ncbi:septum formation initiator [Qaidamihabitans albus]|uniref:septum formation initiator n=1 Tax=Qaidamihabitans albus TaxID=2795733 RepID=UPI0018F23646|nr:septum formation initiator [Qaidamihabitans albus]
MTAPARTRNQPATRTRQRARASTGVKEAPEPTRTPSRTRSRNRSTAAERAYARRAQRVDSLRRAPAAAEGRRRRLALGWPRSRASFVLVQMALLAVGVAATLWLSTQAIADSYRLEQLRQTNAGLAEQAERLQRQVTTQESPSSLADRAKALGMVPGGNPARIVVQEDGSIRVVGEPEQATAPAPPPAPEPEQPDEDRQEGTTGEQPGGE